MKTKVPLPLLAAGLISLFTIGFLTLFTVHQTQRGLVLQLGRLVEADGKPFIAEPGLHIKWPFISRVLYFDSRLQTFEIEQSRIVTVNKKDVIVDSYIKWRINNFAKYYTATGGIRRSAELLLRQITNDALRAQFGKRSIIEVVSGERVDVMNLIKNEVAKGAVAYGIEIKDVRIKRIDLPQEVSESVFERMRAEREQAAAQHRAEGRMEAEKIRANADAKETVIIAKAQRESNRLRGLGDARATAIYAKAHNQNPEFYAFYKSLEAYRQSLSAKDIFVLKPDSEYFKYFANKGK